MKVCVVSHSAGDGGAERVLIETVEVLRDAGIECLVVLPGEGSLAQALRVQGTTCKVLKYGWWVGDRRSAWERLRSGVACLLSAIRLSAFFARSRCDLVITNTLATPAGALAGTIMRLPHIWWIHEFGREDHGLEFNFGEKFSTWLIDRTSVLVLVNSVAVASKFQSLISAGKLRLLYYSVHLNSVDTSGATAAIPRTGKPRICIAGRITEGKGQKDAVWALKHLKDRGVDAELVLMGGGGSYLDELRILARELGLESDVEFTGHIPNPLPLMASCDVAIVCSRCEAFGRVTVEAMKLGKPVVGTRSGGTVELIREGWNGFLYEAGDAEDLASKLEILLKDGELRTRMGEAARAWATEWFTRTKFQNHIVSIVSRTIDARHGEEHSAG